MPSLESKPLLQTGQTLMTYKCASKLPGAPHFEKGSVALHPRFGERATLQLVRE